MLIDSIYLKHKLIDNAIDEIVTLDWVIRMIERIEKDCEVI